MNPALDLLNPYPFEKYRRLLEGVTPSPDHEPLDLSIGEPKHPAPAAVRQAFVDSLDGLSTYPATAGSPALREAIGAWLEKRFGPLSLDPMGELLPVLGSREALFAATQVIIDPNKAATVLCPNPFYQIYEGAALLAGAAVDYVSLSPASEMTADWASVPESTWRKLQLLFICSPGNPTGDCASLDEWKFLFDKADQYGFTIFSDECYSEIYRTHLESPPLSILQAAASLGRSRERLLAFGSLSKRSNVPGMRSGYVAGDPEIVAAFLRYRTYHGSAMPPPTQAASCVAWADETHVAANRAHYDAKYDAVTPILGAHMRVHTPPGGFYHWVRVPGGDDTAFARELLRQYNVRVLPGSYLGREIRGDNPGSGYLRIALVDTLDRCVEASHRVARLCERLPRTMTTVHCRIHHTQGTMSDIATTIENGWENRAEISPSQAPAELREAVAQSLAELDSGKARVAEKVDGQWVVHQWLKKAVLLSFRLAENAPMGQPPLQFYDKVPCKFDGYDAEHFAAGGYRVVPPAVARRGAYIAKNVVLMPSYVNIGAYVDEGTMVDTWATVGSCAQVGKNVHLSGGVGLGGVLEPLQANPTIIEDNCFIGARSEVVEGVIVEENSVLSMGVYISQSTKIYDRTSGEIIYGRVPAGSVVVPGSLPSADGKVSLYCAVIVKRVDAQTRAKTSINELLRGA